MIQLGHPQGAALLAAARRRLLSQMGSLDASAAAVAEMSRHKADGKFFDLLEQILRECATGFDPDVLLEQACARLGYPNEPDEPAADEQQWVAKDA